jgi:hypothetical protein
MIALRLLREGVVVREALFRELPLTIGRAEGCDFPLFDASVSRVHARLERDAQGALVLSDAGSRNGLHVGPQRVQQVTIERVLHCLIGTVEVEIEPLRADDTLELKPHDWQRLERRRGGRDYLRYAGSGVLGWVAGVLSEPSFWSPWQKGRATLLLSHALGALVALTLLGVVLMILLKAFGRRLRMADCLRTLSQLAWLPLLLNVLSYLLYYPLSADAFSAARGVLAIAFLAWGVGKAAATRRLGPTRFFRIAWGAVVVLLAAGFAMIAGMTSERSGQPQLDFHVQIPVGPFAGRSESLDAYFTSLSETAQQAATEAAGQREQEK